MDDGRPTRSRPRPTRARRGCPGPGEAARRAGAVGPRSVDILGRTLRNGCDVNPEAIFIVGVSRSGTTLMRRVLNGHSRIAIATENHYLGHLLPWEGARAYFRRLGDPRQDATMRRIAAFVYSDEFQRRSRLRELSPYWGWLTRNVPRAELERLTARLRPDRAGRVQRAHAGLRRPQAPADHGREDAGAPRVGGHPPHVVSRRPDRAHDPGPARGVRLRGPTPTGDTHHGPLSLAGACPAGAASVRAARGHVGLGGRRRSAPATRRT